ncbi:outer membrane beta-barrel protein [Yeosuana marina]|uniref:outer membrane beta-barrel protein n=1 Tax=Yeosuana marina TaxID=1565536 RepID=UPI00142004C1|nr:outer membrane beta-barrel protein [Yeosuana marina]
MKKLLFLAVFTALSITGANAQSGFKVGVNLGLPTGDIKDFYSLNIGVDANYLWQVSEEFDAGITAGYSHYLAKSYDIPGGGSIKGDDAGFFPIAAAGRFNVSEDFIIGADLGYALGISPSGNDGGFYYAPKLQYGVSESLDIVLAYKGISVDGGTFSSINLGVEFGL